MYLVAKRRSHYRDEAREYKLELSKAILVKKQEGKSIEYSYDNADPKWNTGNNGK